MKKIIFFYILLYVGPGPAYAQTIPVLTEQLAAIRALQHTTEAGYQLVTGGLKTIGSIRNDEFNQHSAYFSNLSKVNPQLANKILSTHNTLLMTKQSLILLIGLFGTAGNQLRSQTIADLVAQLSLDTEKLTSIKGTLQDMYKGYETLSQGYTHIRDIARDNFNLHQLFLDGLWVLSPNVRNDPRITNSLNTEYRFLTAYKTATTGLGSNGLFSPQELAYILNTYSSLLQLTLQSIEELTMVITDNQLRMSDAQRLQAIERIDTDSRSRLSFLQQFNNTLAIQAAQRQQAAGDINLLKSFYGITH
ncbi:MAG TPA: hypothetical protein VK518_01055 [Puia sp.]|nr:hypothetical protein [Puia sp.]